MVFRRKENIPEGARIIEELPWYAPGTLDGVDTRGLVGVEPNGSPFFPVLPIPLEQGKADYESLVRAAEEVLRSHREDDLSRLDEETLEEIAAREFPGYIWPGHSQGIGPSPESAPIVTETPDLESFRLLGRISLPKRFSRGQ